MATTQRNELFDFSEPGTPLILDGPGADGLPPRALSDAFCIFSLGASILGSSADPRYAAVSRRFTAEITPPHASIAVPDAQVRAHFYMGDVGFDEDTGLQITVRRLLLCPSTNEGATDLVTTMHFETRTANDYATWVNMHHEFQTPQGNPDPQGETAYMGHLPNVAAREATALSYSLDQIALSPAAYSRTPAS